MDTGLSDSLRLLPNLLLPRSRNHTLCCRILRPKSEGCEHLRKGDRRRKMVFDGMRKNETVPEVIGVIHLAMEVNPSVFRNLDGSLKEGKAVYEDKTCWYHEGRYHRTDGPAIMHADGTKCWYLNGEQHRPEEEGPAYEDPIGLYISYYLHGKLHRIAGPAIIYNGREEWYQNGLLHRLGRAGRKGRGYESLVP